MNTLQRTSLGALCALALGTSAIAQAHDLLPAVHDNGAVRWLSGGIGIDEVQAVEAAEAHYPLTLEFIEKDGSSADYLAEVPVTIRDQHGRTVLHTVAQGPYLLARLAPGHYTVSAVDHGVTHTDHIALVAGQQQHRVFEWNRG